MLTRIAVTAESPPAATPSEASEWPASKRLALHTSLVLLLVTLVAVCFSPALANDFVEWDDDINFLHNEHYQGLGWAELRWAFTTTLLEVYQPLAWIFLEVQAALWGLDPRGYHATSVVLHAANSAALYLLTVALLQRGSPHLARRPLATSLGAGLAVAAYALHPLRAEVVAWVSCQPYLPCAFFCLLCTLAYLKAHPPDGGRKYTWLTVSYVAFLAALLSKAVAVGLPAVILLLDYYPLRHFGGGQRCAGPLQLPGRILPEKVPFVALTAAAAVVAYCARAHSLVSVASEGTLARLGDCLHSVYFYPLKTAIPRGLSCLYFAPAGDPNLMDVLVGGSVFASATAISLLGLRRWPGLFVAWVSYLALLAPNSGIFRQPACVTADRYSYLASIGPVVLAACGLAWAATWLRGRPWLIGTLAALACGVILVLAALTWRQCGVWKDSETLWASAIKSGAKGYGNLWDGLGQHLLKRGRVQEAYPHLCEAVRLKPDSAETWYRLGYAAARLGSFPEAAEALERCLELKPAYPEAHSTLGWALLNQGRLAAAAAHLREALRARGDDAEASLHLGCVLARQGQLEPSTACFRAALKLAPDCAEAHHNLGLNLVYLGRAQEAEHQIREALRLKADYVDARNGLGCVLVRQGRLAEAAAEFTAAVALAPDRAEGHQNLGLALRDLGRWQEALTHFAAAVRLDPANQRARREMLRLLHREQAGGVVPEGESREP